MKESALVRAFALGSIASLVVAVAACTNPLDAEDFGCDKTAQSTNPHCIDYSLKGDVSASKDACQGSGGKVIDRCAHGLGGCKGPTTTMTSQTTWYFEDETTKSSEDVKKKCGDTSGAYVDP